MMIAEHRNGVKTKKITSSFGFFMRSRPHQGLD